MLENTTFWYALCLFVFVVLTFKTAKSALLGMLDAYADKVMGEIKEVEKLRREAHDALQSVKDREIALAQETQEIADRARAQAAEISQQASEELERILKRREQQVHLRIEQARQNIIRDVRNEMTDVAIQAVERSLASSLSAKDAKGLIEKSVGELPQQLRSH